MPWIPSNTVVPTDTPPTPCTIPLHKPKLEIKNATIIDNSNLPIVPPATYALMPLTEKLQVFNAVIEFPAATFLLQDGSIEPIYPTYVGAFVYDLQLKKWGKANHLYKRMFEFFPINNQSGNIIPYEIFGSDTAIIDALGKIYLHDRFPLDSQITWGKIGYYRKGFTNLEEVKLQFGELSTGTVIATGSLDGKQITVDVVKTEIYDSANSVILYSSLSARWYNITATGIFDITGLEFRGVRAADR
jgi:hypothetical protein